MFLLIKKLKKHWTLNSFLMFPIFTRILLNKLYNLYRNNVLLLCGFTSTAKHRKYAMKNSPTNPGWRGLEYIE